MAKTSSSVTLTVDHVVTLGMSVRVSRVRSTVGYRRCQTLTREILFKPATPITMEMMFTLSCSCKQVVWYVYIGCQVSENDFTKWTIQH